MYVALQDFAYILFIGRYTLACISESLGQFSLFFGSFVSFHTVFFTCCGFTACNFI